MTKLVVCGTSIDAAQYVAPEETWAQQIADARSFALVNSSVSGGCVGPVAAGNENQALLPRLQERVFGHNPNGLILSFGANELARGYELDWSLAATVDAYVDPMNDVLAQVKPRNLPTVLFSPAHTMIPWINSRLPEFVRQQRLLAESHGVHFFDVYNRMTRAAYTMTADAFHQWFVHSVEPLDPYHMRPSWHAWVAAEFNPTQLLLPLGIAAPPPADPPEGVCVFKTDDAGTGLVFSEDACEIKQAGNSTAGGSARGTIGKNSAAGGVFYFELHYPTAVSLTDAKIGFDAEEPYHHAPGLPEMTSKQFCYRNDGITNTNGAPAEASGKPPWGQGAVVGAEINFDAMTIDFFDPSGARFAGFSNIPPGIYRPFAGIGPGAHNGNLLRINCGPDFAIGLPSGAEMFAA